MNVALMENSFRGMGLTNFVGKISGSLVANPNIAVRSNNTSLIAATAPIGGMIVEYETDRYAKFATLDNVLETINYPTIAQIAQQRFSFDLIQFIIRNYGVGIFGNSVLTSERVAWLKTNIRMLSAYWYGYGSDHLGNKATFSTWQNGAWTTGSNHTQSVVTRLASSTSTSSTIASRIDANGFAHFLSYADASNGTIASSISTDYVELIVELNITQ